MPWLRYHRVCSFSFTPEYPKITIVGILLHRFPVTKVLGVNVFFWGVILCCSAAAKNFAGMMVLRVLLGIMEAVIGMQSTVPL